MRRRPLLRAAAVAGGAYMAGKHRGVGEAEAQGYGGGMRQDPYSPPASPPPSSSGISAEDMTRLSELGQLHDQGILTDEEFAQQKSRILAR